MKIKRISIAIIIITIMGVLAYVAYTSWQSRDKTATIDVQSAVPTDINITINGDKAASNGKVAVKPGKYTVVAQRNGFEGQTQNVEAKAYQTVTARFLLLPNSQEGNDWLTNHPDAARELEAQGGRTFSQTSANITAKYPLIAYLPETHTRWRIDYGVSQAHPNDPNAIAIIITYNGDNVYKQDALQWIKDQGFNPSNYEIVYKIPSQGGN